VCGEQSAPPIEMPAHRRLNLSKINLTNLRTLPRSDDGREFLTTPLSNREGFQQRWQFPACRHRRGESFEFLDRAVLWIGSRLLLRRADLFDRITRDDLRELRLSGPGGSYWGHGVLIGIAAGALVAYAIGSSCGPGAAPSECTLSGILYTPLGAGLGAAVGAGIGASVSKPSSRVIYTAP
jgi:hypothetical protein